MTRVLAAMSGGVDSAVTAALLLEQGYDVGGATMLLHEGQEQEIEDAKRSAEALGLPFTVFDLREDFERFVAKPFAESYQAGLTPNPCVLCNKTLKFGLFLDRALALGYEKIATGHYARIEKDEKTGRVLVKKALDTAKDQTYMLWSLSQAQLSRVLLPMGGMTKEQARAKAAELGLAVAHKRDSQDICFIPDGDYLAYLVSRGVAPQKGEFRGPDGRDLGPHRGLEAYTLGQRRGLGIPAGSRLYVVGKEGSDVLLGPESALMRSLVRIRDVNFLPFNTLPGELRAEAKLRYSPKTAPCLVRPVPEGAELLFDEPQRAPTPGQSAVLYAGGVLLGGGIIA
jgi:tRNA-specific 2-thiouridylase